MTAWAEAERLDCFGASVGVYVEGTGPERALVAAELGRARRRLLHMHGALTRFDPNSGLSRLNRDPRARVPSSWLLVRLAGAAVEAGEMTGGLVDATSLDGLEAVGYVRDWEPEAAIPLTDVLRNAPPRSPAVPDPRQLWRRILANPVQGVITRPPGVRIDSGGLAKGLAADLLAADLEHFPSFAIDAAGDIRVGGLAGAPRTISVEDPFGRAAIAELHLSSGGIATSGIGRRTWSGPDGPAHHLIDPQTGRPAFTGVVQATALAPTAFEAEVRAKLAVLAGPTAVRSSLPHGGVVVYDDGAVDEYDPILGTAGVAA
jgi:thiamine biosynthesis lipoprotein